MKIYRRLCDGLARHPRVTMFGALLLAVAVFLIIVLSKIGAWSVWFDESFSAFMIKQNFASIWRYTALDVNAPLYYFLLKGWSLIVGHSDVALRLLSVMFGVGALIGGFFLSKRLFGRRVGYFTLLFLTLSPMLLRYSTEMRCYTLVIFLLILATDVFVVASAKSSHKLWLLYGLLIALAMWTHYYAALVIVAHLLWRKVTTKKFFTRDFVAGLIFAAVLFLPWLPIMVKQLTTVQVSGFWIAPFSLDTVGNFFGEMTVYNTHDRISGWVALGVIAALILMVMLLVKGRRALAKKLQPNLLLILLIVLLPPLVLAVLSMPPLRPMFINRYIIASMLMFSLVVALAVGVKLRSRRLRIVQAIFLTIMLLLAAVGVRNVLHFGNYNFDTNSVSMAKSLMAEIATKSSQRTIVVAENPWIFYDADVYATTKNPVYFLNNSTKYEYGSLAMLQDDHAHKIVDLAKFVTTGQQVWFISSSADGALTPPAKNWQLLRTILVTDPIDGQKSSAAEYLVE